jgi:hypothetical protein
VGGEPTAAADADAGAAVGMGRWGHGGAPSGTSEEHYQMEQPQPPLLGFLVGEDDIVRDHDIAYKL